MQQRIRLGAYGWRQKHWLRTFYPEDLPAEQGDDWRLGYYSNMFATVLVPAGYWHQAVSSECEDWLDSVHAEFRFYVECHSSMFDHASLAKLTSAVKILAPQLSGLVVLDDCQSLSDEMKKSFLELADRLQCELFATGIGPAQHGIWRPHERSENSSFAFVEDDLSDLRKARAMVERYVQDIGSEQATMIVNHPQLQADNLNKFQSVLEIMGC